MIDLVLAADAAPALTGIDFGYTLAGIVTGLVVGITGVGGGAVMTPILILLLGVAPATAVATDLWFAAITKLFGASIHGVGGNIDWQVVRRLWMGSIPVAIIVAVLVAINAKPEKVSWLTTAIGIVVLVTAIGMFLAPVLIKAAQANRTETPATFHNFQAPATIVSGGVVGGLVALTSVGAGALGSVAMTAIYPFRMTPHRLVATDIAHAIPLAVVAGTGYIVTGLIAGIGIVVDPWMLASMLLGSIPTIIAGSFLARRVKPRAIQIALASVLLFVAISAIFPWMIRLPMPD
jgi:uncharacterized membrane protein YfcA